jgi:hypothetical protein
VDWYSLISLNWSKTWMLATQPLRDVKRAFHNPNNPAAAATSMMWAVALATARTAVASTSRSLELWSRILRGPAGPLHSAGVARPATPDPKTIADGSVPLGPSAQGAPAEAAPGEAPAFASYRSSGGHAAAQISKPH